MRERDMKWMVLSAIGLAGLSMSGCVAAAVGAVATTGVMAMQERTIGEGVDDATASGEIKGKLLSSGVARFGEVDIAMSRGLVLLSGRVPSVEDRMEAERIAWSVDRVKDVANEITVEQPRRFQDGANDEWISARVRGRLMGDLKVRSLNFNVETYDGVVYLLGVARTQDELERATGHASLVKGVTRVVSYIELRAPRTAPGLEEGRYPADPGFAPPPRQPYNEPDLMGGPQG
jgi:osmotically-inducible protein OsmY